MATHVFAADLSPPSEVAWNALVAHARAGDTVFLVHSYHLHIMGYFYPALGEKKRDAAAIKDRINAKFLPKCKEAGLNCKFKELPAHTQGKAELASQICAEALRNDAADVWIGSSAIPPEALPEPRTPDEMVAQASSAPALSKSLAADIVPACPCTVHIVKERNASNLWLHMGRDAKGIFASQPTQLERSNETIRRS